MPRNSLSNFPCEQNISAAPPRGHGKLLKLLRAGSKVSTQRGGAGVRPGTDLAAVGRRLGQREGLGEEGFNGLEAPQVE